MKKLFSKHLLADQDIEQLIGIQLRAGVVTASIIVLIGGILYLIQSGGSLLPSYAHFGGEKAELTSFSAIWQAVIHFRAKGIITLGVVILMATPLLRIMFSLVGFAIEKDRMYVLITLFVLMVMAFSIFGGLKV
ncbi:DUF1634 domain-containing protein [Mucilaginibacter sp. KACC 22063]|uniref:DUF1634 domain-containing protein n=1 Tax=Mucilaginibacter sp. KACC 22063 TaxID=3025666 RepID=UPI002367166D|nr:DUF1634 domain-containing protein [Mucilaginibacter sp. KACC 22063]WDF54264.1 DUF1634 domain-containing protein [Mucilaginibacter sp. KACC 22063]